MDVKILCENGYSEALYAIGLSYGKTVDMSFDEFLNNDNFQLYANMARVAKSLAPKNGGHNSFLELINLWVVITAPRGWWVQMDRYRVGKSQLSSSTMHTIQRRKLHEDDFDSVDCEMLDRFNKILEEETDNFTNTNKLKEDSLKRVKNNLPEGFLQKRIVMLNYKSLANIIIQRRTHAFGYWQHFLIDMIDNVYHPELLPSIEIS